MSDENTNPEPEVTAPAEPAAEQIVADANPEPAEPAWLPSRLEQAKSSAKKAVLSELGFDDTGSLKEALDELKSFREASLTEKERLESRLSELTPAAERAAALENTVKSYAERELASLSQAQREAVDKLSGGDPSKVLGAIEVLKPTWVVAAPPAEPAPVVDAEPAKKPETTSAPKGPPDGGTTSSVDIKAEFMRNRSADGNPFKAARIVAEHGGKALLS